MPIFKTRICPTIRGALFRLKRWFYATYYNPIADEKIREKNKERWAKLARRVIEEMEKYGNANLAGSIMIEFSEIIHSYDIREFLPRRIIITLYRRDTELSIEL